MQGIVMLGAGALAVREFPDPEPGPDEIVIAVKASGMCGSDLHHLHEPKRGEDKIVIEGHEPCGIVTKIGSAVRPQEVAVGDRVMIHHYDGCRTCNECRAGRTQHCQNGRIVYGGANGHGAHAHFMKAPAHTAIKMPDNLSFKAGAAIACGAGTAFAALQRVALAGTDCVAIFGQGPVGLAATIFAAAQGAQVIALDAADERLEMARLFGAHHLINVTREDAVAAIKRLSPNGEGATKSLECSANETARRQSVECLGLGGTACMVGVFGPITIDVGQLIQQRKTLIGSQTFSKGQMADCANYVATRGIDLDRLFTHEFGLCDAEHAYQLFDQRKIGKGVFLFD